MVRLGYCIFPRLVSQVLVSISEELLLRIFWMRTGRTLISYMYLLLGHRDDGLDENRVDHIVARGDRCDETGVNHVVARDSFA